MQSPVVSFERQVDSEGGEECALQLGQLKQRVQQLQDELECCRRREEEQRAVILALRGELDYVCEETQCPREREERRMQMPAARRLIPSSYPNQYNRHVSESSVSSRPYGSRGTVEERMSRAVETDVAPLPPPPLVPTAARDHIVSLIPSGSRKRPRPVYLEESDDIADEVGTSDPGTSEASERKELKGSSSKPMSKISLNNGPDREKFSPSGVKLEIIELPVKYDTKEWLKHAEQCPDGSGAPWRCTWQTMKNGSPVVPVPCDYSSKKHLVKRHIEATHLCVKRFQCTWCEKTFTQRSNVAGCHLNTHTGSAPYRCDFCGERFKDPSKRHKHMLRIHGNRPWDGKK